MRRRFLTLLVVLSVVPLASLPASAQSEADGLMPVPLYSLTDPEPVEFSQLGSAMATIGDVDGDSISDIAVGAYNKTVGARSAQGQAFAFSGADGSLLYTFANPIPQQNGNFGATMAGIGDVDGDTVPDVAVSGSSRVFVSSGTTGAVLLTLGPIPRNGGSGGPIAGIGSVDGDSVPDIVVGTTNYTPVPGQPQGQALVFSGANGSLLYAVDNPSVDPSTAQLFGGAVSGLGDVDGDLVPDFAVGAWQQRVAGTVRGQGFVFSGNDGALLYTVDPPQPQAGMAFGRALAGIGDVNRDSIPDLAVGAPSVEVDGDVGQGRIFVFSGTDGSLLYRVDNPTPQAKGGFGSSMASLDDIDLDSVPDIVVGARSQRVDGVGGQGQAFVLSGADGSVLATLDNPNPQASSIFGGAVTGLGDVNGDALPDIAVGAPLQDVGGKVDAGRVFVFSVGRPGSVEGSVRFSDGSPAPGVVVDFFDAAADGSRGRFLGDESTGGDGSYRRAVTAGCYVLVFIAPDGESFVGRGKYFEAPVCVKPGAAALVDAVLR